MTTREQNWARNVTYRPSQWHFPRTGDEVRKIVRRADRVKALGTRHSFNTIADTDGEILSCEKFDRILEIDRTRNLVVVDGGIRYGELCVALQAAGYALPNLASLPHISIAGACATATHGSGEDHGNLATSVCEIEFVSGNGEMVSMTRERDGDLFRGVVVGLGALGVVTRLALEIVPTFDISQTIYERLTWSNLQGHFDEILGRAYSVSLFLDWKGDYVNQVWVKQRVDNRQKQEPEDLFGATKAAQNLHPVPGADPVHCTEQRGVPGPWHERLPHFRMDFLPSSGEELQSEYFVPKAQAVDALHALRAIRERIAPLLHISEVRAIKGDDLWMSPCFRQESIAFHFTWKKDWAGVQKVLPLIEEQLEPFPCRPHWGKLFALSPQRVHGLFERMADFRKIVQEYDPEGKFRNAFVNRFVFEE